ncbi:MFS transporter [Seohaeicola zhoushanensis]|uniref:MFS transporter n=1 Tax=Seohaeicola zhoushanensis TaxID=1569283 RepID=A0A8J3GVJ2_9RHOB|nr:MFS transporter [Seohaeicola zhoushanensis]GHF40708.1 MFS transporter [Seohaeicola zhoushanensis]
MSTTDIHDSAYSWFRLCVTMAIAMVANVGIWAIVLVLPAVEAEFGVSRADASLAYTLTMMGFAAGNLLIGRVVDRFGVTLALIGASVISACGYLLSMVAPTMGLLWLTHLLLGLGTAVGFGPLMADISHWFLRRRGIAVALVASGNYISGGIWPTILTPMLVNGDWRQVYLLLAVVTLVAVIPLALLLRRRLPDEAHGVAQAASDLKAMSAGFTPRQLQWLLGLAGIGCCIAMSMPQVHIVAYCIGLGYGPAVGADLLSLMLLGGAASRIFFGLVADRLGGVRTVLVGALLQALALALYLPWDAMVPLYVISLVFGLSQGGIVPSYALVVREYMPAREAGARVGFVLMMTVLGMAIGGWMSGWIYDLSGSYRMAFLNGVLWNGLTVGVMLLLLARSRPRAPKAAVV